MMNDRFATIPHLCGSPVLYTFDCAGCGACVAACPRKGVLTLVENGRCRFVNVKDAGRCTGCGICMQVCPRGAIRIATK